jgi:hypothetical protein
MSLIHLKPKSGEPLHGYFFRYAQALGLSDIKSFLKGASIKPRVAYTSEQIESLAADLQLDAQWLRENNPSGTHINPLYNLRFQRSKLSPICPQCIAETGYARAAWDHDLVTACTQHGIELVDSCEACGEPITRNRQCLHSCGQCGFDLRATKWVTAGVGELAISALLGSEDTDERQSLPEPLSIGPAPQDVGDFLHYLANHIKLPQPLAEGGLANKNRRARRPTDLAESRAEVEHIWYVLAEWPLNVDSFVRETCLNGTGRSVSQRIGKWLNIFYRKFDEDYYLFFSDAISTALSAHFDGYLERFLRARAKKSSRKKDWLTASEVAAALNSTPGLVTAAVQEERLEGRIHPGPLRYVTVHRSVIEKVKLQRADYLTASEARSILGISKSLLQRLVNAGVLPETIKSEIPPLVQGKFKRAEIQAFQSRLLGSVALRRIAEEHLVGLQDICAKRGLNEAQLATVYIDISEGRIRAVKRIVGSVGVSGLRFDLREVQERLTFESREPMLLKYDLVNYGDWKADDVTAWIKGGFLEVRRERRGDKWVEMVPLSSLIKFMTQYLVLSDASRSLKTTTNYLLKTLQPAKIAAATSPTSGRRPARGLLVESKELIRGAQLRKASLRELADRHCRPSLEGSVACGP